jgi:ABC-2 type transport system ATP-binding protein
MTTLKVKNLFKHYQNAKYISARNISFEVREGEIFGFLGINGAGKSTTIKCITGIIPFTSGKIEICGHDIKDDPYNAKRNFGFVPDNHAVYDKLTGTEYVNYISNLYNAPIDKKAIEEKYKDLEKDAAKIKIREEIQDIKEAE